MTPPHARSDPGRHPARTRRNGPDVPAAILGAIAGVCTMVALVCYSHMAHLHPQLWRLPVGEQSFGAVGFAVAFAACFLAIVVRLRPRHVLARLLVVAGIGVVALGATGAWFLVHGFWLRHAQATSPDGHWLAESRDWYTWGPIYGWNHYYLSVHPGARIRCKALAARWRGTPTDVTDWKHEHHYATYNDFDGDERFPQGIRWLSNQEFVVEGGEGGGSVFEVEH